MSLEVFLNAIQTEIANTKYGESPVELYEPIEYLMSLGGKKMRPLLAVMATNIFSDNWQKAVKPALGVEVFHNFTLMHDDIMDAAPLRRGKPTVHEKWNENIAILSGDVMLVCAYELMTAVDDKIFKHVIRRFNRTAAEVCEGQQWDMNFATRNDVTEDEYINMIRLKTSVLLGFSLELGGLIAEAGDEATQLLYDFGTNIGIGFQLKDDILDVYGDPEKFGKQVGGDIIENKKTWLLLKALELSAGKKEEAELQFWINAKEFDKEEKVKAVRAIYDSLNIKHLAENKMNTYFNQGLEDLVKLNAPSDKKQPLIELTKQLIERES
ncbi:(2E,6E)-farnesyl diphosphate synthase [Emticicia aquatica]|jgi:geranylgeranyl diphosphate synthase type II|uniref:(2E,6E)-farnesyl diphosphate synthase n=1 Tax=Emticicia aquatica TaxID=1681835 RepID=A0ABM9AS69_9BACT|nr:polyprenyl synthetase family protein [Emticicia aquatica]CAH0996583.1 (2E,6E)-farnesyl diphosphate synthase [Emticicia aquatica]